MEGSLYVGNSTQIREEGAGASREDILNDQAGRSEGGRAERNYL